MLSPVGACFFLELPKVSHEDYMLAEHGRKKMLPNSATVKGAYEG